MMMCRTLARIICWFIPLLFVVFIGSSTAIAQRDNKARKWRLPATGKSVSITHDKREREYRIFVPDSYSKDTAVPLVVCLHGGGGNSTQASRMGMTKVAEKEGFIVIYPNAIDKHWNDGRDASRFAEHDNSIDDVSFIMAVVQRVCDQYKIDSDQVFVTGVSNGGFMTQRLALEHSETFSAAATVIASMGDPLAENFDPKHPVSMMYLNGTEDPLVPYEGGEVGLQSALRLQRRSQRTNLSRGTCISTDKAVELWLKRNGIESKPVVSKLPDSNEDDQCHVELSLWKGGENGTAVALYKVVGGGHAVPGMVQYLPERMIGRTNRDIEGFEVIWSFFENHNRSPLANKSSSDDK